MIEIKRGVRGRLMKKSEMKLYVSLEECVREVNGVVAVEEETRGGRFSSFYTYTKLKGTIPKAVR
jgi:hypothetical protein